MIDKEETVVSLILIAGTLLAICATVCMLTPQNVGSKMERSGISIEVENGRVYNTYIPELDERSF